MSDAIKYWPPILGVQLWRGWMAKMGEKKKMKDIYI
jgi:hypothetical protein